MSARPGQFSVLFVCTGNICRSPMAEQFLKNELAARWGRDAGAWQVSSAGVQAMTGRDMDRKALKVLMDNRIDGRAFRSRGITPQIIADADLVLTAERHHRSSVVALLPGSIKYTFTMRQFATLTRSVDPLVGVPAAERGERLLAEAISARGRVKPANPEDLDIEDPIGRSLRTFRACGGHIHQAVTQILAPFR